MIFGIGTKSGRVYGLALGLWFVRTLDDWEKNYVKARRKVKQHD